MAESPVPVLLFSSLTREGAEITLQGLELGALDFVDKSRVQGNMNLLNLAEELKAKIRAIVGASPRLGRHVIVPGPAATPAPHVHRSEVVAIATSTGGPRPCKPSSPGFPTTSPAPSWWCSTCHWASRARSRSGWTRAAR